jgi:hypothetical protein
MIVGIDTFGTTGTHLDLITWPDFTTWNNGTPVGFAGRNFLAMDFLWGHGEATNALTNPQPNTPQNLVVNVPLITPIQAPQPDRQQATGNLGFLYGQIDGQAICKRLAACIQYGELQLPPRQLVFVWLAVDPTVALSTDYWAGWSNKVYSFSAPLSGYTGPQVQAFAPAILCQYTADASGTWQPDPHVSAIIAAPPANGYRPFLLWADAPNPDAGGVPPNPLLNWNQFSTDATPAIWRFALGIRKADNTSLNVAYSLDAIQVPPAATWDVRDYMLSVQPWQATRTGVDVGFSFSAPTTVDQLNFCMLAVDVPAMTDSIGLQVNGGPFRFLGRYIKTGANVAASLTRDEAVAASQINIPLFTTWENVNALAHGEPVWADATDHNPLHIGIQYFNPNVHAGTEDGQAAFAFAGQQLMQPPHTAIYFTIDGDPSWDARMTAAAHPTQGDWIVGYFDLIRAQRTAWVQLNPGRPYVIGVYGSGRVCRELYTLGKVDMFWQAVSAGFDESGPPRFPWPHSNRWQYTHDKHYICGSGPAMDGVDPDADWGDGGTWLLTDPLEVSLEQAEGNTALYLPFFGPFNL